MANDVNEGIQDPKILKVLERLAEIFVLQQPRVLSEAFKLYGENAAVVIPFTQLPDLEKDGGFAGKAEIFNANDLQLPKRVRSSIEEYKIAFKGKRQVLVVASYGVQHAILHCAVKGEGEINAAEQTVTDLVNGVLSVEQHILDATYAKYGKDTVFTIAVAADDSVTVSGHSLSAVFRSLSQPNSIQEKFQEVADRGRVPVVIFYKGVPYLREISQRTKGSMSFNAPVEQASPFDLPTISKSKTDGRPN
jgi:hypothetical protein